MKYKANTESAITIYKNAIVHNNNTTLFFVVNLYNFNLHTLESSSKQIDMLYNLIENIENIFGTLEFSIFRFKDILSPKEYIESFIKTIRLWDDKFTPSRDFINNIQYTTQSYCMLAVSIDEKKSIDFAEKGFKEILKDGLNSVTDLVAGFKQQQIDKAKIDSLSTRIANVGQGIMKPCPEDVLLSYYVKRVFPSYDLIIPKEEYDSSKSVLSYLQQDLTPYFNYFEMSNAGVELFGAEAQTTYGSVVDIVEFPSEIISEAFSLNHDWLVVNCKTLTKQKAKLKFARRKRDIEYEEESAAVAGSNDLNMEIQDYKDIADAGLAAVSLGKKICECDIHILVLANSVEELNKRRYRLITMLKNQSIVATFAPNQAKEYVDSFVKLRPSSYPYLMDLRYPLSFRLSDGAAAGDFDSKYVAPVFGEVANRSDATD